MKQEVYKEILEKIRLLNSRDCTKVLTEMYPHIPARTLGSIFGQVYQRKMKKSHARHHTPEAMENYYQRYIKAVQAKEEPGVLLRLSDSVDLSPALMGRVIIEMYLNRKSEQGETVQRSQVSKLLKDTTLIQDRDLAYEVYLCILHDDNYGPVADTIKHSIGQEYEHLLYRKMKELNMAYQNEEELRKKGYDKTPDIKLEIPIAVDGLVVNWIESKASFGDEESHRTYLKDQFWSYWNRFGPGLVIYWFGFLEKLDQHREKGIMLRDSFPTDIKFMDPKCILPI